MDNMWKARARKGENLLLCGQCEHKRGCPVGYTRRKCKKKAVAAVKNRVFHIFGAATTFTTNNN